MIFMKVQSDPQLRMISTRTDVATNGTFFSLALQPSAGYGLLVHEVS
jgi:hypothetical protein